MARPVRDRHYRVHLFHGVRVPVDVVSVEGPGQVVEAAMNSYPWWDRFEGTDGQAWSEEVPTVLLEQPGPGGTAPDGVHYAFYDTTDNRLVLLLADIEQHIHNNPQEPLPRDLCDRVRQAMRGTL